MDSINVLIEGVTKEQLFKELVSSFKSTYKEEEEVFLEYLNSIKTRKRKGALYAYSDYYVFTYHFLYFYPAIEGLTKKHNKNAFITYVNAGWHGIYNLEIEVVSNGVQTLFIDLKEIGDKINAELHERHDELKNRNDRIRFKDYSEVEKKQINHWIQVLVETFSKSKQKRLVDFFSKSNLHEVYNTPYGLVEKIFKYIGYKHPYFYFNKKIIISRYMQKVKYILKVPIAGILLIVLYSLIIAVLTLIPFFIFNYLFGFNTGIVFGTIGFIYSIYIVIRSIFDKN